MRFLKTKVRLAQEAKKRNLNTNSASEDGSIDLLNTKNEDRNSYEVELSKPTSHKVLSSSTSPSIRKYPRNSSDNDSEFSADDSDFSDAGKTSRKGLINNTDNEAGYVSKRPDKNVPTNFGRAIIAFAMSYMALPYLNPCMTGEKLSIQGFQNFLKKRRTNLKSMQALIKMVVPDRRDDETVRQYKKIFQMICEVFIKYFSVNWIIHSKLVHKMVYLKHRHKMLRKIQNP